MYNEKTLKQEFKKCTGKDIEILQKIMCKTFTDTYRAMNTSEDMENYLMKYFNELQLRKDITELNCEYYLLYHGDNLVGYIKINESPDQSDINENDSLELERIYVIEEYKGKGFGRSLIEFATNKAVEKNKEYVWLGVWDKNYNAISFYEKMGFIIDGTHIFILGENVQSDYIMKKYIIKHVDR